MISELVSFACETVDAIGWRAGHSTLIEVKVSRSDFRVNKKKLSVLTGTGVGRRRYFLCPSGLIKREELGGTDYGLLYTSDAKKITVEKEAQDRESHMYHEVLMLTSALRRKWQGGPYQQGRALMVNGTDEDEQQDAA